MTNHEMRKNAPLISSGTVVTIGSVELTYPSGPKREVTTPGGTTVRLTRDDLDNTLIVCDHPPSGLRNCEVGRVDDGCFQSPFFLHSNMLRAIADLLDENEAS